MQRQLRDPDLLRSHEGTQVVADRQLLGELIEGVAHLAYGRIDTGQGRGHHEHVRTAGAQAKFG